MELDVLHDGNVLIKFAPDERKALGPEADILLDWFTDALIGLAALRNQRDEQMTTSTWHNLITALEHKLAPRLDGLRDALIRAHADAKGSIADLALAMDVERSTAQYRRDRVLKNPPSAWENWARNGGPQYPV